MGWRDVVLKTLEATEHARYRPSYAVELLEAEIEQQILAMPPADRIALARELLAETNYGLIYKTPPRKCPLCKKAGGFVHSFGENDAPLLVCKSCGAVGPEHSDTGWNACRAAMLGGE